MERDARDSEPTFVEGPNRERFYSDRFYVNHRQGDADPWTSTGAENDVGNDYTSYDSNSSQEQRERPLQFFDRVAFINSLDLKAVIVGTYVLDPLWMTHNMPTLFPTCHWNKKKGEHLRCIEEAKPVPVLLLHGHKGLEGILRKLIVRQQQQNEYESRRQHAKEETPIRKIQSSDSDSNPLSSSSKKRASPNFSKTHHKDGTNINILGTSTSPLKAFEQQLQQEYFVRPKKKPKENCNLEQEASTGTVHSKVNTCDTINQQSGKKKCSTRTSEEDYATDDSEHDANSCYYPKEPIKPLQNGHGAQSQSSLFASSVYLTRVRPAWRPPVCQPNVNVQAKPKEEDQHQRKRKQKQPTPPVKEQEFVKKEDTEPSCSSMSIPDVIILDDSDSDIEIIEKYNGLVKNESQSVGLFSTKYDCTRFKEEEANPEPLAQTKKSTTFKKESIVIPPSHPELPVRLAPAPSPPPPLKTFMGVYHPKFWILLEESGSLIIIVSTSNLTRPTQSIEGSWIQRFPPARRPCGESHQQTQANKGGHGQQQRRRRRRTMLEENDFGDVLCDFLAAQDVAAAPGSVTPSGFLRDHVGYSSLDMFRQAYHFERASVHLVATVPGRHPGRHSQSSASATDNTKSNSNRSWCDRSSLCLYGSQRMAHIVHCLQQSPPNTSSSHGAAAAPQPWLPSNALSCHDRLLLQPTSITRWTRQSLLDIARDYLACDDQRVVNSDELLRRIDLLWPTQDYIMKSIKRKKGTSTSSNGKEGSTSTTKEEDLFLQQLHDHINENAANLEHQLVQGSHKTSKVYQPNHLFLSSTIFNSFDLAVLSCFKQYDSALPPTPHIENFNVDLASSPPPHFKSYARLLQPIMDLSLDIDDGEEEEEDSSENQSSVINLVDSPVKAQSQTPPKKSAKSNNFVTDEERFAWFLVTSANLSPGAQGRAVAGEERDYEHDLFAYANFELGVLFASRLQGKASDRLYVTTGSCTSKGVGINNPAVHSAVRGGVRKISLPVPYNVRPQSYQEEHEDADFMATPYFHEIPAGSATMSNMLLTPLGRALSNTMNS
jgi:hypothetical protein